jgi:hypothetical protein
MISLTRSLNVTRQILSSLVYLEFAGVMLNKAGIKITQVADNSGKWILRMSAE